MRFHETGLPKNKIVEDAFNYSYANVMSYQTEAMRDFTQQITMGFMQRLEMLDESRDASKMSADDYKREKEALEKMRDEQLKMGPRRISEELNGMFRRRRLHPAMELQNHSENLSPELLAAVLLSECVRSPIDYQNVEKKFGSGIAGLIAEVHHIDAYPSERDTILSAAGADTKRAYMAVIISSLDQIVEQVEQMAKANTPHKIMFPPGQEEGLYNNAKLLWGNDKKLDQRFLEAFNRTAEATESHYRMEAGSGGALELVKGALTPPKNNGPKGPGGGSGSIGDDVF